MKKTSFSLLGILALSLGVTQAAAALDAASACASRYQSEVGTALAERSWRITQEEAGRLTAERRWIHQAGEPGIYADDNSYVHLTIHFRADNRTRVATSARASLYIYEPLYSPYEQRLSWPPLAFRSPELTREYADILAEAQAQSLGNW